MVEDNICRECDSELDPKLKYCPNCKCNTEIEKIEKIDDTPQKMRPKNSFQKLTESVLWGIMMVIIGGYQLLSFGEWYFQIIGVMVMGLGVRNLYRNYQKKRQGNSF
ncbi:MAG: hypothetical protein HOK63_04005 [Thaumarchaeota archaeon]|jgi:hypothetical protein|nr:hypothetical protein [Nitrososphaerota archaeon]MBT5842000.1 hypothetical protein [Nitrososphaerota archaeon]MBT6468798.1 hypothetical protein [Nitrososphaerota archaeon]